MSYKSEVNFARGFIRHINPLMFGVINDKPEGVASRASVYSISHQLWAGLCLINPRSVLHEGFIITQSLLYEIRHFYTPQLHRNASC